MEAGMDAVSNIFMDNVTLYYPAGAKKITLIEKAGKKRKEDEKPENGMEKIKQGMAELGMSLKTLVEGTWESLRGFIPLSLAAVLSSAAKVLWATFSLAGNIVKYYVIAAKDMAISLVRIATQKVFSFCGSHPFKCLKGVILLNMSSSILSATYLANLGCNFAAQQVTEKAFTTLPTKAENGLLDFSKFLTKVVGQKGLPDSIMKAHEPSLKYMAQFMKNFDSLRLPETNGAKALFELAKQNVKGALQYVDSQDKGLLLETFQKANGLDPNLAEEKMKETFEETQKTLDSFLSNKQPPPGNLESATRDYLVVTNLVTNQLQREMEDKDLVKTLVSQRGGPSFLSSLSGLDLMKHNAQILENFFTLFKPNIHSYISQGCDAVLGIISPVLQTCDMAIEDAGQTVLSFSAEKIASYLPFMGNPKKFMDMSGLADVGKLAKGKFDETSFATYLQAARTEIEHNPAFVARNLGNKSTISEVRDLVSFGYNVHGRAKEMKSIKSVPKMGGVEVPPPAEKATEKRKLENEKVEKTAKKIKPWKETMTKKQDVNKSSFGTMKMKTPVGTARTPKVDTMANKTPRDAKGLDLRDVPQLGHTSPPDIVIPSSQESVVDTSKVKSSGYWDAYRDNLALTSLFTLGAIAGAEVLGPMSLLAAGATYLTSSAVVAMSGPTGLEYLAKLQEISSGIGSLVSSSTPEMATITKSVLDVGHGVTQKMAERALDANAVFSKVTTQVAEGAIEATKNLVTNAADRFGGDVVKNAIGVAGKLGNNAKMAAKIIERSNLGHLGKNANKAARVARAAKKIYDLYGKKMDQLKQDDDDPNPVANMVEGSKVAYDLYNVAKSFMPSSQNLGEVVDIGNRIGTAVF